MAKDIGMTIHKGIVVSFLPCLVAFWGFHPYMFFHFLECFFVTICAQLPSRLGMQLNLRLRSLYVLSLCLYVPYTCCYYSCNETLPAPGAPRGASVCSRWRPDELHGCRLCTSDARRIRQIDHFFLPRSDKSITSFYPGRLTTAPTRLEQQHS